jgi:hypothetical protein
MYSSRDLDYCCYSQMSDDAIKDLIFLTRSVIVELINMYYTCGYYSKKEIVEHVNNQNCTSPPKTLPSTSANRIPTFIILLAVSVVEKRRIKNIIPNDYFQSYTKQFFVSVIHLNDSHE